MYTQIIKEITRMKTHVLFFSLTGKRWERNPWCHRVATFLRNFECDAEVIDFTAFWPLEDLKELVRSRVNSKTTLFCFGTAFLNPWSPYLNNFLYWLKKSYPTISIAVGGQNALVTDAHYVDYWIDSYGENATHALLKYLTGNANHIKLDKNIKDKKVLRGLHSYPSAPLTSYLLDFEDRDFMLPSDCPQIETSRGCKFACSYCNFPILNQKTDVSVSANEFEKQLKIGYEKWGIKNWRFVDETFNDRIEKLEKYANVVDNLDFKPWFTGFCRGDLLVSHRKHWDTYIKLGFLGHSMGIETFNKNAGRLIRKGIDPQRLKEGLIDFERYTDKEAPKKYRGQISLICGLPYETFESWYETIEWLNRYWTRQSASAWTLEISEEGIDLTNESELTKNFREAGIRKIAHSIDNPGYHVYKDSRGDTVFKTIQTGGVGTTRLDNIMIWEHDTMNWYQAQELVKEFYNEKTGFRGKAGGNPILSDRLFAYKNTNNYEDVCDLDLSKIDTADDVFKKRVGDYIQKKLSWTNAK